MKIILKVGDNQYILANGSERGNGLHVGPSDGFSPDSQIMTFDQPRLDAEFNQPKSGGNESISLNFSVMVTLDSAELAQDYAWSYRRMIPRVGELRIVNRIGDVDVVDSMPGAVVQRINPVASGCSVNIFYSIRVGEVNRI